MSGTGRARSAAVAVLLLTALAGRGTAVELDLDAIVELALAQNPALRAEAERRQEVAEGIRAARAAAWPQVDVVASWSRARNPTLLNSPDFDDIIAQFPDFEPREQELWDAGFELEQVLYSSGKVEAGVELAGLVVDVTEAQINGARLDTALRAAESYYELLAARSALEAVEIQQRARRESLEVVEARYELGEATLLERLQARSALAEVAPAVARIRGRIEVAKSRLRVALGLAVNDDFEIAPAEGRPAGDPPAFEDLMERARSGRPELADLELQAEALERQRTVTLADGRPQVELAGRYGRQARLPENLADALFEDWRVAVRMSWSVFDGGRRRAEAAQLESRRDQLGWRLADLESRIAFEIEEALAEYRTARERWRAADAAAEVAREASRVARETYRLGVTLQADVLDAQEREIQAELLASESFYDVLVRAARLRRAVGLLPTEPLP